MALLKPEPSWGNFHAVLNSVADGTEKPRVKFGLPQVDRATGGFRQGHLSLIAGPAHGFKTQATLGMVEANPDLKFAWVSPDEGYRDTLEKFIMVHGGLSEEEFREQLKTDRQPIMELAEEITDRVAISSVDTPNGIHQLVDECVRHWGRLDCLVFDYVELLEVGFDMAPKMAWLKKFATVNEIAVVAIHQSVKAGLDPEQDPNLGMLAQTGHKEAFTIIWMKRPYIDRDDKQAVIADKNQPSVEAWVLKAKRGRTLADPIKVAVDPGGAVSEWTELHTRLARGL